MVYQKQKFLFVLYRKCNFAVNYTFLLKMFYNFALKNFL